MTANASHRPEKAPGLRPVHRDPAAAAPLGGTATAPDAAVVRDILTCTPA